MQVDMHIKHMKAISLQRHIKSNHFYFLKQRASYPLYDAWGCSEALLATILFYFV